MINFKLKDIDHIVPVGQEPNKYLSWFWLTDGELWLDFDNTIVYEYSKEASDYFGNNSTPYNKYYLVRFIEDFSELFSKINETVPDRFYNLAGNLKKFQTESKNWFDIHNKDENENTDFYFDEYYKLISWINERTLTSGHIIGGPNLSFFRRKDKLKIVWETEYILENGVSLWTAEDGCCEIDYHYFINEIKLFGEKFFSEMSRQIGLAVNKDYRNIELDKQRLVEEQQERKDTFWNLFKTLEDESVVKTNWTDIEKAILKYIKI